MLSPYAAHSKQSYLYGVKLVGNYLHSNQSFETVLTDIQSAELKEEMRMHVRSSIGEFQAEDQPRLFTLPGPAVSFERDIYKHYSGNVHLEGVERDTNTFRAAQMRIQDFNIRMTLHRMSDLDYWATQPPVPFDMIWADYCGQFCEATLASFRQMCGKRFFRFLPYRTPRFFLTVKEGQERFEIMELVKSVCPNAETKSYREIRIPGYSILLNRIALQEGGMGLKPIRVIRYRDRERNTHAVTMLLFLFEVVNHKSDFDFLHDIRVRNIVNSDNSLAYG